MEAVVPKIEELMRYTQSKGESTVERKQTGNMNYSSW